jgi:hypothetical protein
MPPAEAVSIAWQILDAERKGGAAAEPGVARGTVASQEGHHGRIAEACVPTSAQATFQPDSEPRSAFAMYT